MGNRRRHNPAGIQRHEGARSEHQGMNVVSKHHLVHTTDWKSGQIPFGSSGKKNLRLVKKSPEPEHLITERVAHLMRRLMLIENYEVLAEAEKALNRAGVPDAPRSAG